MAEGRVYVCANCQKSIEAWDEGNPYYYDASGAKQYAYHPSRERELCVGIESEMLCLGCGEELVSDSEAPLTACPSCESKELVSTWKLKGRKCPYCRMGKFKLDPNSFMIS